MLRPLAITFFLVGACSDSDLSGNWSGSWNGGGAVGTLTESLSQDGSNVSGSATFTNSPCWNIAQLALVVDGEHLSGTADIGGIAVDISATWDAAHIDGTFTVPTGTCTGTGMFTLDRR